MLRFIAEVENFLQVDVKLFCDILPGIVDFALGEDVLDIFAGRVGNQTGNANIARVVVILEQIFDGALIELGFFRKTAEHFVFHEGVELFAGNAEFFSDFVPVTLHGEDFGERFAAEFGESCRVFDVAEMIFFAQSRRNFALADAVTAGDFFGRFSNLFFGK